MAQIDKNGRNDRIGKNNLLTSRTAEPHARGPMQ